MASLPHMTIVVLGLIIVCLSCGARANTQRIPLRYRGGRLFREAVAKEKRHHQEIGFFPNTTPSWFTPPIDHNDATLGTFEDKFYYDLTFWNGTGPCMMYLNGEAPCGSAPGGYMAEIAQALGACTLSIEHRWYGVSLPAPLTNKALLTKTLTVDQAMRDVIELIKYFESTVANRKLTWMLVGGSYSGAMTVWMNEKYPGFFKASWAASGVVYATFDFTNYDGHVKQVLSRDCAESIQATMRIAAAWYDDPSKRPQLYNMMNIPSYFQRTDLLMALADASAGMVQYSARTEMCDMLLPFDPEDDQGTLTKYLNMVFDQYGSNFLNSCGYSAECMANTSMSSQWPGAGYSWVYETCNEMAWWQVGYPGSLRNENVTVDYFMNICRKAFYPDTEPDTWAFNDRHHGRQPQTQGFIVATQGSDDPWMTTGLTVSQGPTFPVDVAQCTNCGHCGSMMSPQSNDPAPLKRQRVLVLKKLTEWIARP